ncbi:MAG TPA: PfkB family carbohydrate kinase [Gemmatimonadaceae bacterium]|nr:PfkB family carbohydrate kinase [Gemmatimonadaceae bacterium]
MKRLGVIGTFVWDVIHGRQPHSAPVEEWGGITYSLGALDAALPADWEIVPLMKIGSDLLDRGTRFIHGLERVAPDAALVEVPYPNNRVELRYVSAERRTETLTGGVPGWNWLALKPLIDAARLDAIYVNFLSGWELDLPTAQALRQHFRGPIYADLHMLVMAVRSDGLRVPRPLSDVREWCGCFDFLQANEEEIHLMAPDPMALAATAMHEGATLLSVTLGSRGAVYFAAPTFQRITDLDRDERPSAALAPIRTELIPAERVAEPLDPTGCGDVWGATHFSRLLAGDNLGDAIRAAHRAAARNVEHRGASGLADHLRGKLSVT